MTKEEILKDLEDFKLTLIQEDEKLKESIEALNNI